MKKNLCLAAVVSLLLITPFLSHAHRDKLHKINNRAEYAVDASHPEMDGVSVDSSKVNVNYLQKTSSGDIFYASKVGIGGGDGSTTRWVIRKIDHTTQKVFLVAGNTVPGTTSVASTTPQLASSIKILDCEGLGINPSGDVLFVSNGNLVKVDHSNGRAVIVASCPTSSACIMPNGKIYYNGSGTLQLLTPVGSSYSTSIPTVNLGAGSAPFSATNMTLKCDHHNNLFIFDGSRILKVDTSGTATVLLNSVPSRDSLVGIYDDTTYLSCTSDGVSVRSKFALNSNNSIGNGIVDFCADDSANIYYTTGVGIKKVNIATGMVNTVAGNNVSNNTPGHISSSNDTLCTDTLNLGFSGLLVDYDGGLMANTVDGRIVKFDELYNNTMVARVIHHRTTPRNAIPAVLGTSIYLTHIRGAHVGDSATVSIVFGDGTNGQVRLAYWSYIDGGETFYGLGDTTSSHFSHVYTYPGIYTQSYNVADPAGLVLAISGNAHRVSGGGTRNIERIAPTDEGVDPPSAIRTNLSIISPNCSRNVLLRVELSGYGFARHLCDPSHDTVFFKCNLNNGCNFDTGIYSNFFDSTMAFKVGGFSSALSSIQYDLFDTVYFYPFHFVDTIDVDSSRFFYGDSTLNVFKMLFSPIEVISSSDLLPMNYEFRFQTSSPDVNEPRETEIWDEYLLWDYRTFRYSVTLRPVQCWRPALIKRDLLNVGVVRHSTALFSIADYLFGNFGSLNTDTAIVDFGDGALGAYVSSAHTDEPLGGRTITFDTIRHTYAHDGIYRVKIYRPSASVICDTLFRDVYIGSVCPLNLGYYQDDNSNCHHDSSEINLREWSSVLVDETTHDTSVVYNGGLYIIDGHEYRLFPNPTGFYHYRGADSLTLTCYDTASLHFTAHYPNRYNFDFGFGCTTRSTFDVGIKAWAHAFIPGDTGVISAWSSNAFGYTCGNDSATVIMTLDSALTYVGMQEGPNPTSITGNILRWDFHTANHLFNYYSAVKVRLDTAFSVSNKTHCKVEVTPRNFVDPEPSDNVVYMNNEVRGSWDPNMIEVAPAGYGPEGYVPQGTEFAYNIHFQNTGTAAARRVRIMDTIDASLNIYSLQIVNSSAPVQIVDYGNRTIGFLFYDINLPDSGADQKGSNGYVTFAIAPNENLNPGTQIRNRAGIYFDYNTVVLTNTVLNTIEDTVCTIAGRDSVCTNGSYTYTPSVAGGVFTSTTSNVTLHGNVVTPQNTGRDTLVYTLYGGDLSAMQPITILALPDRALDSIYGASKVCEGATIQINSVGTGGVWSMSNNLANVSNGVVTGIRAGIDSVIYTMTNYCGSVAHSLPIEVAPKHITATLTGATSVCEGAGIQLNSSNTTGVWFTTNSNATIDNNGLVSGVTAGAVDIKYAITHYCGIDTFTLSEEVLPLPHAGTISGISEIHLDSLTVLSATNAGGIWVPGNRDLLTIDSFGNAHATGIGTTTIYYVVTNTCGSDTAQHTLKVLGNHLPNNQMFMVVPNPNSGSFTIKLDCNGCSANIRMIDMAGRTVLNKQMQTSSEEFNLHGIPTGMYNVEVNLNGEVFVSRVVVE